MQLSSRYLVAAVLAAASIIGTPMSATAESAAALPPTGTVRLFQSDNRVLVMVRVGDGELLPMVFDIGSDGHSFDTLVARHNHLRRVGTTQEVDGTSGRRRLLPRVAMPNASIGGLTVGRIEGALLEYNRDDAMGIISPESFAGRLLVVDLAAGEARVIARDSAAGPVGAAIDYEGGLPAVGVTLPDGTRAVANLDTGFDGTISFPPDMMKTLPLHAPARKVGRYRSIGGEGDVYGARVRGDVALGPLLLHDPEVTFLPGPMNIGLPLLRRLVVTLDPEQKRDWIACAGGGATC